MDTARAVHAHFTKVKVHVLRQTSKMIMWHHTHEYGKRLITMFLAASGRKMRFSIHREAWRKAVSSSTQRLARNWWAAEWTELSILYVKISSRALTEVLLRRSCKCSYVYIVKCSQTCEWSCHYLRHRGPSWFALIRQIWFTVDCL